MKKIALLLTVLITSIKVFAQPCSTSTMNATTVFVFSISKSYTPDEIYGQQVNPILFNVMFVATKEQKHETDSLVLAGSFVNAIFVFPKHLPDKTLRYCTGTDYVAAIKQNIDLKISEE